MRIIIPESYDGTTIKEILNNKIKLSGAMITFLKSRNRGITLNAQAVTVRKTVKKGDVLDLNYTDDITIAEKSFIIPTNLPLNILYEDDDLIVLNKPPFMPTHPSQNHRSDTLANALKYYFDFQNIPFVFRAINRLDNATSGIVLVAKNKLAANILSHDMVNKKISKSYLAVLNGRILPTDGEICVPLKRERESIIKRVVDCDGSYSLTKYKTLTANDNYSFVEATPITGRTHQLRVHFAHLGYPICGDTLYGYSSQYISRQALHAYKISFIHPTTDNRMTITAKLPSDMLNFYNIAFTNTTFDIERIFN